MTDQERIEESHGLWELAIVRLATIAELSGNRKLINAAVAEERKAFKDWQRVSNLATDLT